MTGDIAKNLYFEWRKDSGNDYLIDGFWFKEIGNPIFTYPDYPTERVEEVTIRLTNDNGQPVTVLNGATINITDGANFVKNYTWEGSEIKVNLPKNKRYIISTSNVQYGYKNYFAPANIEISTENGVTEPITLVFTTIPVGVYPLNNDGTYDDVLQEGKTYYVLVSAGVPFSDYIPVNNTKIEKIIATY